MPIIPSVKWSQRKAYVSLKVMISNAEVRLIKYTENSVTFKGISLLTKKEYEFSIETYKPIDDKNSRHQVRGRYVEIRLIKKNADEPYWPRVTKEKVKLSWLQVDWDNYVSESEEDEESSDDDLPDLDQIGDFDFGGDVSSSGSDEED